MSMTRTPLIDATLGRLSQVRSEWWAWSRQAYEEAIVETARLNQMREPQTVIVHNHPHGESCVPECVLLEPEVDPEPQGEIPATVVDRHGAEISDDYGEGHDAKGGTA